MSINLVLLEHLFQYKQNGQTVYLLFPFIINVFTGALFSRRVLLPGLCHHLTF